MYNWQEILKNKSRKELYDIYLGKSMLNSESEKFAEIELRNMGFKFDNLELEKEKMELESLIEEKTSSNSLFFKWSSKTYFYQLFIGIITMIMSLIAIFMESNKEDGDPSNFIGFLIFITIINLINFYMYIKKIRYERYRDNRIKEILNKLK